MQVFFADINTKLNNLLEKFNEFLSKFDKLHSELQQCKKFKSHFYSQGSCSWSTTVITNRKCLEHLQGIVTNRRLNTTTTSNQMYSVFTFYNVYIHAIY